MSVSGSQESQPSRRDLASWRDEELAELVARTRDEAAWVEVYRRYRQRIYLWCYRYTHDLDEAVDCAQEVFIRIHRGLGGYRRGARLSTWIYQIARNHCLSLLALQGRRWRQRLEPLDEVDPADDAWESRVQTFEQDDDLRRLLDAASRWMPAQELEAFVLHYREGLTVKEITRTLGCVNVTGARSLIQNARRKFQRLIERKEFADE